MTDETVQYRAGDLDELARLCASADYPEGAAPWEVSDVSAGNGPDHADEAGVAEALGLPLTAARHAFRRVTSSLTDPDEVGFGSRRGALDLILEAADRCPAAADPSFLHYWTKVVSLADRARDVSRLRRALEHAVRCAVAARDGDALTSLLAAGKALGIRPDPADLRPAEVDPESLLVRLRVTDGQALPTPDEVREVIRSLDAGRAPDGAVAECLVLAAPTFLAAGDVSNALLASRTALALDGGGGTEISTRSGLTLAAAMVAVGELAAAGHVRDSYSGPGAPTVSLPEAVQASLERLDLVLPARTPAEPGPRRAHLEALYSLVGSGGSGREDAEAAALARRGGHDGPGDAWLGLDLARARRDDGAPEAAAEVALSALVAIGILAPRGDAWSDSRRDLLRAHLPEAVEGDSAAASSVQPTS